MMTLQEFRDLETPNGNIQKLQLDYLASLLLAQNPRLRRGEDMSGPAMYAYGTKKVLGKGKDENVIYTEGVLILPEQLSGHPWIELPSYASTANWFHLYSVEFLSPFDDRKAGAQIRVAFNGTDVLHTLTQEEIDSRTELVLKVGFTK